MAKKNPFEAPHAFARSMKKSHSSRLCDFSILFSYIFMLWKNVHFSNETKINRVCADGKRYVRRPPNTAFDLKYTKVHLKHGGGNVKIQGRFSGHSVGHVKLIEGNMDHFYTKIYWKKQCYFMLKTFYRLFGHSSMSMIQSSSNCTHRKGISYSVIRFAQI